MIIHAMDLNLTEFRVDKFQLMEKVSEAVGGMGRTVKCPQVWKPSLYMFLSLALSISTHEGHFYWYTDPEAGPAFSQVHLLLSSLHM